MSDIRRVLVVGGGVGGLTAATTFARRGVEVVLIERRPAFDVPGVGLGQPANALRVYDALGLLPEILASGFAYDRMSIFDSNRALIVEHKFLLGDERVPAFCALSRLRLHEILLAAAERAGVEVRTGVTVSEIQDEKDRVAVTFSDGRSDSFDLLAGFDGIRSATRQYLFGAAFMPRLSGYGAWRVQVPRPDYVRGMEFLQGIGSKTGAMPLSDNLMYVFHIRPEAPDAVFKREDYADLFKARLAQYGSYVAAVAASLGAVAVVPRPRRHRRRCRAHLAAASHPGRGHGRGGRPRAGPRNVFRRQFDRGTVVALFANALCEKRFRLFVLVSMDVGRAIGPHAGRSCRGTAGAGDERFDAHRRKRSHS